MPKAITVSSLRLATGAASIDLYGLSFWALALVAVLLLSPLVTGRARKVGFALANVAFLSYYLGTAVWAVLAGLVLAWCALQLVSVGRVGGAMYPVTAAVLAVLFLLHKAPSVFGAGLAALNPILTTVGFSYVALRTWDAARAVREGRHPAPDLAGTVNYLVPFHMLAAGPIQSYDEFVAQAGVPPAPGSDPSLAALERIAQGMFKKYVLANLLQQLFLTGFRAGGAYTLVELQANYLWLYLDFSAYSDIAVGLGAMLGVATPENFNRPYVARNIIDFWERWHISLSLFIRRTLFIPIQLRLMRLTGGRAPLLAASVAFTASFLLCGLWHGVGVRWLIWGLLQSIGLIACNAYKFALLKRLGRKGVDRYLANRWFRLAAVFVTFEYQALAMAVATGSLEDLACWLPFRA